ncbi:MAG: hypothetical protein JXM69_18385 [Anaerolineae bacterium]|nr:hypothetical protein [Anaerolineae bacterium]
MITDLPSTNQLTQYFSYLATKLHIPPTPPSLVPRPRLIQQLNQSIQYKLLLVSAPAGYGKTTMLSDWSQRSEWPVAWVSLDGADNDPIRFWSYVITALDKLGADLESILDLLQATHTDSTYHLTGLINALAGISDDFVLILDDYHCIENDSIHTALTFLLDYLPAQMHLILAGRVDPPLPLARWRARGQLMELGIDDLRFSQAETQTLLQQTSNADLSAQDITLLQQCTEGWVAGLHLTALTVAGSAESSTSFLNNVSGDHRYIVDYLAAEVLQQQPEPIRNFLLQTAILNHLHAGVCNAVTGRNDSRSILAQIEQRNLFLVPLDGKRQTYRYHHLFADFLRDQLQQTRPDEAPSLHRKAAAWCQQHGDVGQAINHFLSAKDFTQAVQLIEDIAEQSLIRGEMNTLLNWFKLLPEELVCARPKSCLYRAWALTHAGQLAAASQYLALVDQFEPSQTEGLKGQRAAIQARLAVIRGNAAQIIDFSEQALRHLPADNLALRSEVSLDMAFACDQDPNCFEKAWQAFEEAIKASQKAGNSRTAMMASYYLAYSRRFHGQLQPAAQLCQHGLQWSQQHASGSVSACWVYVGLGELLYEWNNLAEAADHLQHALAMAQQSGEIKVLIYGYTTLAQLLQAQGQSDQALATLQTAENIIQKTDITVMIERIPLDRISLWLRQGQVEHAANWVQAHGLHFNPQEPASLGNRILIRLAMAQPRTTNKVDEAIDLLNQWRHTAQTYGQTWELIRCLNLLALVYDTLGDETKALDALEEALALAQPLGLVRTFVDEGPAMAALLQKYARRNIATHYVTQLLAAFGEDTTLTVIPLLTALPTQPLVEPLRQRELEVLQHISAGRSNKEIADEMILAVSTVKWHLKNIYGKLQVKNRTQALARARELNLL